MQQKSHVEGLRALVMYIADLQDRIGVLEHDGADGAPLDALRRRNDLLLPLIKGYGSEKVYDLLAVSLQCFGGSGYCQDYPIEQYIRDQKIDSLYEGTTHIQALDLFFRKIGRDGGATLRALLGQIKATADGLPADLGAEQAALETALADVQGIVMTMLGKLGQSVYHAGLQGNRILFALAELVIGWLWLRQAVAALEGRAERPTDAAFYEGKLASCRWWSKNVLPSLTLARKLIEASSLELMALSDEAF
jgi:hypothetical protein